MKNPKYWEGMTPTELQETELLLLRLMAKCVAELTLGNPLSIHLTQAYKNYAEFKEVKYGRNWLDNMHKKSIKGCL